VSVETSFEGPGPVLIPLDGSEHSLHALPVALELARVEGRTPLLLNVGARYTDPRADLQRIGLAPERLGRAVFEVAEGAPSEAIARIASERGADLVVLCTRTGLPTGFGDLGPIAAAVLRSAPCPVVLVRPQTVGTEWHLRTVLLPHDGTPTSAAAISSAARLSRSAGARLDVLHVTARAAALPPERGSMGAPRYVDQPQHEWPVWAQEFLGRLCCDSPVPQALHLGLAYGDPGAEIVRHAVERRADLIVLAWRGNLDADHAASVRHVLRNAPCPAYVLRVRVGAPEPLDVQGH
jgi:nucleotide-binding universal stress UspA family protein